MVTLHLTSYTNVLQKLRGSKMASRQVLKIAARTFSSSAVGNQMVKPPVQVFGIEGRYACALYSAGSKSKQLEAIEKDLVQLQGAMKTDVRLQDFILNPILSKDLKVNTVKKISDNAKFASSTANLLACLAENGRLKKLNAVINAYKTIMAAHRGDLPCEVVSAKPLDDSTKQQLASVLKSFAKKGENVLLDIKVDPSIVGGLIVSIGDKYVDMSIASKIKKYSDLIQSSA